MKCDTISISSDEDVPLNALGTQNLNTFACLNARSIQPCEFCDEVFLNRYTALIHNASHIIIPLLKQNVYQCVECLFYFTSQTELQHHKETKHKEINIKNEDIKPDVLHMAISDIVKKELDVKLEDYLIQNKLQSPKKIKEEIHIKEEVEVVQENGVDTVEDFPNVNEDNFRISNRLHFEGDSDDESDDIISVKCNVGHNGLLNDLTTVCKVNLNLFDKPWVDDGTEKGAIMEVSDDSNIEESAREENEEPSISEFTPSVHYEDLIKPGMYSCRRCSERFPTKFHLIQHDMWHVKIRKPRPLLCIYCERFISNIRATLKEHVEKHHNKESSYRPKQFPTCKKCGLKYFNYIKHAHNYHVAMKSEAKQRDERPVFFCQWCNRAFYCEEEKSAHINAKHLVEKKCHRCGLVRTAIEIHEHQKTCLKPVLPDQLEAETLISSAMLKLCEMCCMFLKSRHNIQYSVVNTVSEVGSRMDCDRCGKKFFELKLVKRTTLKKSFQGEKERKKHLSNSARLKNIQQRLKMFNKLSRC